MQYIDKQTGKFVTVDDILSYGIQPSNAGALAGAGLYPVQEVYPEDVDYTLYTIAPSEDAHFTGEQYVRNWNKIPLPLPLARTTLKVSIAARRYEVEMGGVDWVDAEGRTTRLGTDVESRTRLQTAIDGCPESGTIQYKVGDTFHALTRAELIALRDVVTGHVQVCFDKEAVLFATIDTAESVEVLVGIGWEERPHRMRR